MKKLLLSLALVAGVCSLGQAQQFLQITTVESVVPGGLGRSRMIDIDDKGDMSERKMENFFSMMGINFGNIRSNDAMITQKISELYAQGWKIMAITPGVYSADKSTGIFITRYLFTKE